MTKPWESKKWLTSRYINKAYSAEQIADICDTHLRVIRHWLKKHKLLLKKKKKCQPRRRNRSAAIEYMGYSKCCLCGYNVSVDFLEFHHVHPNDKLFTISSGLTKAWVTLRRELDKCVLLCANCHKEAHHLSDVNKEIKKYWQRKASVRRRNLQIS